jgi:glutamine synthetase
MENIRFTALEITLHRKVLKVESPKAKISDYYAEMTFNKKVMREYLPEKAYTKVIASIEKGEKIERKIADQVAASLKSWAISKGATHYSHWFHPLTGSTAEKHDAFISPLDVYNAIEEFGGNNLIQQEPDASSFPSGGIRNTFEARGYTAWDPTSPAFILDNTLCIPTIFVSYTGEALDYKTPLLKALNVIDKAAVDVCRYFDKNVKKVNATLGWEQEYFLIDSALFFARPDMVLTGRTVFGHPSAKDQQLSDHYFGVIPRRVLSFMKDFEIEAHRLGIPVKTRHNEVAPSQFECAPVFEEANLAVDHNQLLMHILYIVAKRHDLTVLLHEKPYANINGSGKHNNWSLMTDTGINLLSPGKTGRSNLRFITFLVNILKALHTHADLIGASIATAGNDNRLGGHEAPPAIISAFIGSHLTSILNDIESKVKNGKIPNNTQYGFIRDVAKIPEILLDNTDRNRTSPFAFTGNKFEFRAVGSSDTCSKAMIAINLIVADQLVKFKEDVDSLIADNIKKDEAIFRILKRYISESKDIRFEGNNYSHDWIEEAKSRKLTNIGSTPIALKSFINPKTIALFEEYKILTKKELCARYETYLENYTKKIQIESRVIGDLATNHIIPIAIKYQNILIENTKGLKDVLDQKTYVKLSKDQISTIKTISEHISEIKKFVEEMINERKKANRIEKPEDKAIAYSQNVVKYFEEIRRNIDKLEMLVDDEFWPLPKYRELLFMK